jgi:hypothetical protein
MEYQFNRVSRSINSNASSIYLDKKQKVMQGMTQVFRENDVRIDQLAQTHIDSLIDEILMANQDFRFQ